jgi:hypothetical protein
MTYPFTRPDSMQFSNVQVPTWDPKKHLGCYWDQLVISRVPMFLTNWFKFEESFDVYQTDILKSTH